MSELSFSNANKPHFSISLLLSDLMLLFSSIISHPLYFLYFVFFSPYIFKLLSFLSPLFITTFLLVLALLTVSPTLLLSPESSDSKLGFLLEKCGSVLDKLRPIVDGQCEDLRCFEELEAYKIVFEAATFEVRDEERQPLELESEEKHCLPAFEGAVVVKTESVAEEKRGEGLLEVGEDGNISEKVKDKKVKAVGAESDKVDGQEERLTTGVSEGVGSKIGEIALRVTADNGGDYTSKGADDSQMVAASVKSSEGDYYYSPKRDMENLGSFGSMRKEKEWKRTLACKLFEERNNADGGEGMDLLWETYETDSSKVMKAKNDRKNAEEERELEEKTLGLRVSQLGQNKSAGRAMVGHGNGPIEVAKTVLEVAEVAWSAIETHHHIHQHHHDHDYNHDHDSPPSNHDLESLRTENRRLRSLLQKNLELFQDLSHSPCLSKDCPPDLHARLAATVDSKHFLSRLKSLHGASVDGATNGFPFKEATGEDLHSAEILINVDPEEPSWWVWVTDEAVPNKVEEWSEIDDENYVVISEEHVVDGVANFIARCILSNPKTLNLTPEELQKAVSVSVSSMNKYEKMASVWHAGMMFYTLATWGIALAGLYRSRAVMKLAAKGVHTTSKFIMKAL